MRYLLLIFLMLCLPCWAATTYYVDPGHAGSSETGAIDEPYLSLFNAEAARQANIIAIAGGVIFECKCSTATNDTTAVTVLTWSTDADSPITIQSSDRSYKLVVANADALTLRENYIVLDGITVQTNAIDGDGDDVIAINSQSAGNLIQIKNCTIIGANNGTYYQRGIHIYETNSYDKVNIWNTLVYNIGTVDSPNESCISVSLSTAVNIYNCTVVGGKYGINAVTGTVVCKNTVALGSLTADFVDAGAGATTTQIHCASEDATGNDFDTNADGNIVSQTLTAFTALYRLTTGNPCIDAGVDLSGDTPAVTDDIDGTARGATYDIGCDEYVASGMNLFRRKAISW